MTAPVVSRGRLEARSTFARPSASGTTWERLWVVTSAVVVLVAAWMPVDLHPTSGMFLALALGAASIRGLPRGGALAVVVGLLALAMSGASGWDAARASGQVALASGVFACYLVASTRRPRAGQILVVAVGLALLGAWGLLQVTTMPSVDVVAGLDLTDPAAEYLRERLAGRRAFAQFVTPGHLAVVLSMAIGLVFDPMLGRTPRVLRIGAAGLAWMGILLTRSPLGVAFGLAATVVVVPGGRLRKSLITVAVAMIGAVVLLATRPDMKSLEPVRLRADNWRAAIWTVSTAPVAGVGFGSFGQVSQGVPFEVGNHPAHAHSLPLEVVAELGVAGMFLVVVGGAALGRLVVRLWSTHPGLAVAVTMVPVHNLVDFSLYTSSVALPWAIVLGWATAVARTDVGERPSHADGRFLSTGTAFAVIVLCVGVILHQTSRILEDHARVVEPPAADLAAENLSAGLAPWRIEPRLRRAVAALENRGEDDLRGALSSLERSRWLRPNAAAPAELRGRIRAALGDRPGAVAELVSAVSARPFDATYRQVLDELLRQLEASGSDHGG